MGYYTKHIIKILPEEQATKDNYLRFCEAFFKNSGEGYASFRFHDGLLDDANWNSGCGRKWYSFHKSIIDISKAVPDLTIQFMTEGEDYKYWLLGDTHASQDAYLYTLKNGEILENRNLTEEEVDNLRLLHDKNIECEEIEYMEENSVNSKS